MGLSLDVSPSRAKIARAIEHLRSFEQEFADLPEERKPYAFSVSEVDQNGWIWIFVTVGKQAAP
jgi:hypothetical protein